MAALGPVPLSTGRNRAWREGFVAALEASGLAGRGGANFPAAIKLSVAHTGGRGGTIVVNGMEGEPASDKDKLLLLRNPHHWRCLIVIGIEAISRFSPPRQHP